jgi:hypothetical protein
MAFPTTSVLDDFNRADESPLGNSTWAGPVINGGPQLKLASNQVESVTTEARGSSYWSSSFSADQEVYADIVALDQVMSLYGRTIDPGATTRDGYQVVITSLTGPDNIVLNRVDDETATQLGASMSSTLSANDAIGLECSGSNISVYTRVSGTWGLVATRVDATYASGGVIGIDSSSFSAGGKIDNFGGGNIVTSEETPVVKLRSSFYGRRR